jgi:hypothetical protein
MYPTAVSDISSPTRVYRFILLESSSWEGFHYGKNNTPFQIKLLYISACLELDQEAKEMSTISQDIINPNVHIDSV